MIVCNIGRPLATKKSDQFSLPRDFGMSRTLKLEYQLGTIGRLHYEYAQKTELVSHNRCFYTYWGKMSGSF